MNLWRTPLLGQAIFSLWKVDARRKLGWIKDWIKPGDTLVDIGSGPGSTLSVMRGAGYHIEGCLLYTSPSPRDGLLSRMPSSA